MCFVSTVLEQKRGKTLERLRRGLLGVALLRLGVGYHQVLDSCRQYRQELYAHILQGQILWHSTFQLLFHQLSYTLL